MEMPRLDTSKSLRTRSQPVKEEAPLTLDEPQIPETPSPQSDEAVIELEIDDVMIGDEAAPDECLLMVFPPEPPERR
jgi:hypothetical protein